MRLFFINYYLLNLYLTRKGSLSFEICVFQERPGQDRSHQVITQLQRDCHVLALVIFVFFIILVRSGCDMGDLCVFPGLGVL